MIVEPFPRRIGLFESLSIPVDRLLIAPFESCQFQSLGTQDHRPSDLFFLPFSRFHTDQIGYVVAKSAIKSVPAIHFLLHPPY